MKSGDGMNGLYELGKKRHEETEVITMRLLGPFEMIDRQGEVVTPGPAKMRILLTLLCAHAGTVLPLHYLQTALWSDEPPRSAATALHVYISRLRKHLQCHGAEPGGLQTRPAGYVIDSDAFAFDHIVLRNLMSDADVAESQGRIEEAAQVLRRATALRRGPALGDLRDVRALSVVGRQLDEQLLVACGRKAELELRLDRHAELIPELLAIADDHPTHERIHQILMLCLYRSGRTVEALAAYARLRERLIDAAGLEPSTKTQQLQSRILRFDHELDHTNVLAS